MISDYVTRLALAPTPAWTSLDMNSSPHPAVSRSSWSRPPIQVGSLFLLVALCSLFGLPDLRAETAPAESPPATASPEQLEYFEKSVRPLLVEHCFSCHGEKKQQGGLRLDSPAEFLKSGDSGVAVVPGKPSESRMIQVLHYSPDDIQMPPAGKLSEEQIAILTRWIEWGAPWPADAAMGTHSSETVGKTHWAFQPLTQPEVPRVSSIDRVSDPLDAFILRDLEAQQLTLGEPADRATFIRRATFDLWGIPPTYAAVKEFEADTRVDAVPLLIDRLLESPLYGQRWARHWLDVARYADTKGYVFTEEPRYPYAYTYRDYVVDSFNHDKPYDRFLLEQIAADQLDLGENREELAALGFLTVGRRFLNRREDIIDDRIDVVTRGLMALTVTCARCHDHKYDPVPTADYYSLFGVFASSEEPAELPIIGSPKSRAAFETYQQELAKLQQALDQNRQQVTEKIHDQLRRDVAAYFLLIVDPKANNPDSPVKKLIQHEPRPQITARWKQYLAKRVTPGDRVFGAWNVLTKAKDEEFAATLANWLMTAGGEGEPDANPLVIAALSAAQPQTKLDLAAAYGKLFAETYQAWLEFQKANPEAMAFPDGDREELRQILYEADGPSTLKPEEIERVFLRDERNKHRQLVQKIESLQATSPGAPPRAMVMHDKPNPEEPRIFVRGNVQRPGDRVPRQFLGLLAGDERQPFQQGSGRLELARAIASPDNPLTARVMVNRVWQHHFGQGLSRTPGDFGIRGEAPTNPELLDHLTSRFIAGGWSIKALHRWIMTSATYAQSSAARPDGMRIDPENYLYWRMPSRRLEFEALRDSWLAVADRLDVALAGRPFDDVTQPDGRRRTLYAFVNRNDLPGVFRSFDFADVDVSMAVRPETTVPQQALFAMNSPFVLAQARALAQAVGTEADAGTRVMALFQKALSRDPTSEERERALAFLQQPPESSTQLTNWEMLAQALLLTNEFAFVD